MTDLTKEEWSNLNQYQHWALEILNKNGGARLDPSCPLSMKTAMFDLWRFGMADKKFDQLTSSMSYTITDVGRTCAASVLS